MVETNVTYEMMTVCEERGEGNTQSRPLGQASRTAGKDSVPVWAGEASHKGDLRAESSKKTRLPGLAVEGQGKGGPRQRASARRRAFQGEL